MNSPMISIPMGGVDFVLGIQWLQSLGTMAFNFQELFMKFLLEGKEIELRGITGKPGKVISSNGMTKLLKKSGVAKLVIWIFKISFSDKDPEGKRYVRISSSNELVELSQIFATI